MEIKIRKGSAKKTLHKFKSLEEFEASHWPSFGWSVRVEPSEELKEIVQENTTKVEDAVESTVEDVVTPTVEPTESIEDLRDRYTEVTGNKVANRYKNDAEWLKNKIDESFNK